jgi:hypothetical protein
LGKAAAAAARQLFFFEARKSNGAMRRRTPLGVRESLAGFDPGLLQHVNWQHLDRPKSSVDCDDAIHDGRSHRLWPRFATTFAIKDVA